MSSLRALLVANEALLIGSIRDGLAQLSNT